MHFTLILATMERVSEVAVFLDSLARQSYRNFALIIVDQNTDGRLDQLVAKYEKTFKLKRIFSHPGLSRSRNAALPLAVGDVVAFPDDDCIYPAWLLEEVSKFLCANGEIDGVTGRTIPIEAHATFRDAPIRSITPINVWQRAISYTIFLRQNVVKSVGLFDEMLGVGAGTPWGAAEETDFLLRALALDHKLVQHPALTVHHPDKSELSEASVARAYRYSCGVGRVLAKNRNFPIAMGVSVLRTLLGLILAVSAGNSLKVSIAVAKIRGKFRGIISGFDFLKKSQLNSISGRRI